MYCRSGVFSTMLDHGSSVLEVSDWPEGVRIVLVTSPSGDLCAIEGGPGNFR